MLWIWIISCFALLVVEMLFGGEMTALALAIGTLGAMAAAALNLSLSFQLVTLGITSLFSVLLIRPLLRRHLMPPTTEFSTDSFIGQTATVLEPIHINQKGKVKIHGETWFALSEVDIPAGEPVIITAIDGTHLHVLPQHEIFPMGVYPLEHKALQARHQALTQGDESLHE